MDKLNRRLTLIANISVVLDIIFLAVEVQQNTQAIQAQTRDSITEKQMEYLGWVATTPELAAIADRVEEQGVQSLTGAETYQWQRYVAGQWREWENSFYQFEQGLFDESEFEARRNRWRRQMVVTRENSAEKPSPPASEPRSTASWRRLVARIPDLPSTLCTSEAGDCYRTRRSQVTQAGRTLVVDSPHA